MVQTPIVVKESLSEIKFTTYVLFSGVIALIIMLITMSVQKSEPQVIISEKTATLEETVDSVNIALASYGYVICLFPIMKDMKEKS